jgi:alpha-galactosidase
MNDQEPASPPFGAAPAGPDPEQLTIAYIGGGSRSWAPTLMRELALTPELSGEVALYDIDHEAARRNERLGAVVDGHEDAKSDWEYAAYEDRADALDGADFVMLSTQFPIPEAHARDLEIPEEHGVYQPVAVTIGPAGVSWNMRTVPVYRDIAAAVREHCPDAWVFNYSNPLTHLTRALYKEFPDINAVGLCHEVRSVEDHLAGLVGRYLDVERPPASAVDTNVLGINHFTWIDEATWRGHDLFDLLDHHLEQEGVLREYTGDELLGDAEVDGPDDRNQVAYELYRRFGVLAAAGDRHLVEYAPWFLQGEMPADLHRWGVVRTTVEDRMEHWVEGPKRIEAWVEGEEPFELTGSDEEMVDLMKALLGMGTVTTNVNVPNRGQMVDAPEGAVVETNAEFGRDRVTPHVAGRLPRPVHNMVTTHIHNQETLVDAAFEGDVDAAFRAFLNDPQVTLQVDAARELFAHLVAAHEAYLDDWALGESTVLAESDRRSQ